MKKIVIPLILLAVLGTACGLVAPQPTPTATPSPTATSTPLPTETPTPTLTPTPAYPPEGLGPANFPADIDPLTGLKVSDPALLERRPIVIKVSNLPRSVRPQWGLSKADIVYEYYTEEGSTRYAAVFYGNDTEQVGPIRSARFFDASLIRGYKALFAFGSADVRVRNRLYNADYANRLILEWQAGCPAMCRFDPNGYNYLLGNTKELSAYATRQGIPNNRQNLDGMFFKLEAPAGGVPLPSAVLRYSAAIYNRWMYDPTTLQYMRYSDKQDDLSGGSNEVFELLTDRLTSQAIAADNVVVLMVTHQYYLRVPEMVDMLFTGSGTAYTFRDGQVYQVKWQRPTADSVISLTYDDGTPFPFKPGTTWFEVMGTSTEVKQIDSSWRFIFHIP